MKQEPDKNQNARDQALPSGDTRSRDAGVPVKAMKCEDIQAILFDYVNHELGPARTDLVREHLRKCPACQSAVSEMQETLDVLHEASRKSVVPERLSAERREHIVKAITHPVADWMERNRLLTIALLIVLMVLFVWAFMRSHNFGEDENASTYTVTIGAENAGRNPNEETKPLKLKDQELERRLLEEMNQRK